MKIVELLIPIIFLEAGGNMVENKACRESNARMNFSDCFSVRC